MKNLLLLFLLGLSCTFLNAQFDVFPPDLLIHDSLGMERNLDSPLNEGYNAALFYYWASWCPPCRDKIETLRLYADSWKNNYNVKILLIVYDREPFDNSDSLESVNYWRDYNLDEVGDLYFVHKN